MRELLREIADKAKIDKRVSASGLKATFEARTAERSSRIVAHLAAHIDETTFREPLSGRLREVADRV